LYSSFGIRIIFLNFIVGVSICIKLASKKFDSRLPVLTRFEGNDAGVIVIVGHTILLNTTFFLDKTLII
jgi:hypothetical protein